MKMQGKILKTSKREQLLYMCIVYILMNGKVALTEREQTNRQNKTIM